MQHRSIAMLVVFVTIPGFASALTSPVSPEEVTELLPMEATAMNTIEFIINCRYGDTEVTEEELFVRWGYGSALHTEGGEYASGCPGIVTLSDTLNTGITTSTVSLYENDFGVHQRLDLGPTGACANTITFDYANNRYLVDGVYYTNGGAYATVGGQNFGEPGCNDWGQVQFRIEW